MPPESHPNITMSLFWILFVLWCLAFVILSMAAFDMNIAEYNATCYLVNFYNFFAKYYLHVEKRYEIKFQYVNYLGIRLHVIVI